MEGGAPKKAPPKLLGVVLLSFGLATLSSVAYAILGCSVGILFSGLGVFLPALGGVFISSIVASASTVIFRQAAARLRWRMVWVQVPLLALVVVTIMAWLQTRQSLKIFMKPLAVPASVRVKHGHQMLFSSFVNFSASASDIATLIQSKGLVEVPDWDSNGDAKAPENFSERERARAAWDWWQPALMSGAKFYFRHHKSDAVQGWGESWWINDKTNEVFAYISG